MEAARVLVARGVVSQDGASWAGGRVSRWGE